ncbi:hypothetical protein [Helicobacter rodentium]|uniref:hypothetical protein n=1 Tax=Helicobacter rodentium TaxID=59617 RepID=UPI002557EEE4|nr:hypothetical protein [Helicobacter rodentium]
MKIFKIFRQAISRNGITTLPLAEDSQNLIYKDSIAKRFLHTRLWIALLAMTRWLTFYHCKKSLVFVAI